MRFMDLSKPIVGVVLVLASIVMGLSGLNANAVSLSSKVSFAEWEQMTLEQRKNFIFQNEFDVTYFKLNVTDNVVEEVYLPAQGREDLFSPVVKKITQKLSVLPNPYLRFNPNKEHNGAHYNYNKVGKFTLTSYLFFSEDDQWIGSMNVYEQKGCVHYPDSNGNIAKSKNYPDMETAVASGCEDEDLVWTGATIIDHKRNKLSSVQLHKSNND